MSDEQNDLWARLSAPFPVTDVQCRVVATNEYKTRGQLAYYLDARAVQDRLDAVLGPDGWYPSYRELGPKGFICALSVRVARDPDVWITKEDAADLTQIAETRGGVSRALARAASVFGVGRYLYHVAQPWVDLDERGRPKDPPPPPREATAPASPARPASSPARPDPQNPLEPPPGGYDGSGPKPEALRTKSDDAPRCPDHDVAMVKRHSSRGDFWGCPHYPACRQTRKL